MAGFLGYQYFQSQSEETQAQVKIAETLSNNAKEMLDSQAKSFVKLSIQQQQTIQTLIAEKANENRTHFSKELEKRGELASERFMK
ncbi:hypothetical protein [Avibacterium paragallinarum]|uniref:Uncharacterized protein n=1 Tax=Avibacterium paragallinarum TaxID=728 RepID=A0ABU7QM92_AVIPA|nr:hypothetical protein [Avibacterium paragallinarum]MEE3608164.1 hypothetical protein [Avibacterium paragallinarum]MEE3621264.1 hypothetical protein [Avibacterium paragallinarum]MEE3669293.1 hypothetical protein [Avibacterium paragallinarum]MEE3681419.1 hypothetical protein [Avibacterium paragallinarum]MEE4386729.1 hypothetical protein [Avibacterium paragallinarum]